MDELVPLQGAGGHLLPVPEDPDLGAALLPHPLDRLPALPQHAAHLPPGRQHPAAHDAGHLFLLLSLPRLVAPDPVPHHPLPHPHGRGRRIRPGYDEHGLVPHGGVLHVEVARGAEVSGTAGGAEEAERDAGALRRRGWV